MPTYLVFRTVGELSEAEIEAASRRAVEVDEQMPDLRWVRSYYSSEEGKLYCEYEAPGVDLVLEHSRRAGMPVDRASVVQALEPSMFW